MKKLIVISVLICSSATQASDHQSWFQRKFSGSSLSQEPRDKKPGLFERAKSRVQSYQEERRQKQEERQQKKFQAQLGGIAGRAGLTSEEQKRAALKKLLTENPFQNKIFNIGIFFASSFPHLKPAEITKLFMDFFPHLYGKSGGGFKWYEIFNVSKFANQKQVQKAKNKILNFITDAKNAKPFIEKFLNNVYREWEQKLYTEIPHEYINVWNKEII